MSPEKRNNVVYAHNFIRYSWHMWTVCTHCCLALHATCQQQQQQREEQEKPIIANELECGSAKMSTSDKAADKAAGPCCKHKQGTTYPPTHTPLFPCSPTNWAGLRRMQPKCKRRAQLIRTQQNAKRTQVNLREGGSERSQRERKRERKSERGRPLRAKNALPQRAGILKYLARR